MTPSPEKWARPTSTNEVCRHRAGHLYEIIYPQSGTETIHFHKLHIIKHKIHANNKYLCARNGTLKLAEKYKFGRNLFCTGRIIGTAFFICTPQSFDLLSKGPWTNKIQRLKQKKYICMFEMY